MMKLWWNDICELVAAFAAIVAISAIVDVTKTHRMGHQATSLWTLHEIFRDTLPLACRYACLFWTTIPSTIPDISTSDLLIYPHSSLDEFLVGFGKKKYVKPTWTKTGNVVMFAGQYPLQPYLHNPINPILQIMANSGKSDPKSWSSYRIVLVAGIW